MGAIGTLIATGLFRNQKLKPYYFLRTPKDQIGFQAHDTYFSISPKNVEAVSVENQLDWLIICLKEYHFEGAKDQLARLIFPKTKIAVIRNGLDLKEPLLPYAEEARILEVMINASVQPKREGFYELLSFPKITLPQSDLATEFENLFFKTEEPYFLFSQVEDFKTAQWKKLIESASLGAIQCLTGETCRVFEKKEMRVAYENLVRESIQVAQEDGANISHNFVNVLLEKLGKYPPHKGSSMLTDLKNGRPIEWGAKNGVISKIGKKLGVATTLNDEMIKNFTG